jgi:Type ISP C-terminal specificity domain
VDVWLNGTAYWRAVPKNVWEFIIGGYLVFKKWLSYREHEVLGRPITTAEAREATAIIRRLTAIIIMQPELDANYRAVSETAYAWPVPVEGVAAVPATPLGGCGGDSSVVSLKSPPIKDTRPDGSR